MKTLLQKTFFVILIAVAICTPLRFFSQGGVAVLKTTVVSAVTDTNSAVTGLRGAAEGTGLVSNTDPITLAATIVKTLLGFLGIVFIVLLLYGGGIRMFSQGKPDKVKSSTDIIKSAVIGIFIIFASYIITTFVFTKVSETVGGNTTPTTNSTLPTTYPPTTYPPTTYPPTTYPPTTYPPTIYPPYH